MKAASSPAVENHIGQVAALEAVRRDLEFSGHLPAEARGKIRASLKDIAERLGLWVTFKRMMSGQGRDFLSDNA